MRSTANAKTTKKTSEQQTQRLMADGAVAVIRGNGGSSQLGNQATMEADKYEETATTGVAAFPPVGLSACRLPVCRLLY